MSSLEDHPDIIAARKKQKAELEKLLKQHMQEVKELRKKYAVMINGIKLAISGK